jgi:hypothetical protein
MKKRIAFDLDETLAVALVDARSLRGFAIRPGCTQLLDRLAPRLDLILWSSSERGYLNRALEEGLKRFFKESYSWAEMPHRWKDIRLISADYLVDDSDHHFLEAKKQGIEGGYIIIPPFGAPDDRENPLRWTQIILNHLRMDVE